MIIHAVFCKGNMLNFCAKVGGWIMNEQTVKPHITCQVHTHTSFCWHFKACSQEGM